MKLNYEMQISDLKKRHRDEIWDHQDTIITLTKEYEDDITDFLCSLLKEWNVPFKELYSVLGTLDKGGWIELGAVQEIIPCDLYGTFYYEDNTGVFDSDDMDGYDLIHYYEINQFSDFEYTPVGSMHEKIVSYTKPSNHPDYPTYREKVYEKTALALIRMFPRESMKLIRENNFFSRVKKLSGAV